jgi:hypothetical protein
MATHYASPQSRLLSPRQKLFREVRLILGEGMIKVELTPEHLDVAIDTALDRYRQRSSNSVEERIGVLELIEGKSDYFLPEEVCEVRQLFRRGITGTSSGTGANFDPFSAVFANQFAFAGLGAGPLAGGVAGDLITYEIVSEYQGMLGRMFGARLDFQWTPAAHRLSIQRYISGSETILMLLYIYRTEEMLLSDTFARTWLRDYTVARAQIMIGEAREKFGNIPSPQGGVSLNGAALKSAGIAEILRLENEVKFFVDSSMGMPFCFG